MATNRNTATPNPHAPGGWTFTRPVDRVEVGDRVRDPLDGEWREVIRVDGSEKMAWMADGGVMSIDECTEIATPSEDLAVAAQDHIVTVTPGKLGMRKKLVNNLDAAKAFARKAIREGHAIAGVRIQIGDCETKWMVYLADNDRLVPCAREEVQGFNALCERLGL